MKQILTMLLLASVAIEGIAAPALEADQSIVSLSAVKDKIAQSQSITIRNVGSEPVETAVELTGKDAAAFELIDPPKTLEAGATGRWTLAFRPTRGAGLYLADLKVGGENGLTFSLRGVGLAAFEGKNEPSLDRVVQALGIPVDVGGKELSLGTMDETIGDSTAAGYFRAAGPGKVKVTALARFSPKGETPIGIFRQGDKELKELVKLGQSTEAFPDAHQALFPPFADGTNEQEFDAGEAPFGFYMAGHFYTAFTDSTRPSKGKMVKHAARIFPVTSFQGNEMKDTWLVGFEEAKNGDYQDLLLLVENASLAGDNK